MADIDADVALYGPIPDIISMSLDFLATYYTSSKYRHECLFTQPGTNADVDMILDGFQEGCVTKLEDLFFLTQSPHTIGLLITECLYLLPSPLLPPSLFLSIVPLCGGGAMSEAEERESANALRTIFEELPDIQLSVLENIFHFLHLLHTTTKFLSLSSLSSLSLSLLQIDPATPSPPAPPPRQLDDVMSFFVRHADALFGIYHIENVSDLARDYEILHDLGEGQFGVAKKIVHKKTHLPFAVKIIPKQKLDAKERSRLATEIQILKRARHPNIIGLRGVCDTPDALLLIMELAEGGDLFDFLQTRATYQV